MVRLTDCLNITIARDWDFMPQMKQKSRQLKKVNKQCLLDTPRTVRVSEKTWQVIVETIRPKF